MTSKNMGAENHGSERRKRREKEREESCPRLSFAYSRRNNVHLPRKLLYESVCVCMRGGKRPILILPFFAAGEIYGESAIYGFAFAALHNALGASPSATTSLTVFSFAIREENLFPFFGGGKNFSQKAGKSSLFLFSFLSASFGCGKRGIRVLFLFTRKITPLALSRKKRRTEKKEREKATEAASRPLPNNKTRKLSATVLFFYFAPWEP